MRRGPKRMRVDGVGRLEIVDPGLEDLCLLQQIDPHFAIQSEALPGFVRSRFQSLRQVMTGVSALALDDLPIETLWVAHDRALAAWRADLPDLGEAGICLLDLKAVIARRLLNACVLCARRCGADRASGETGMCGLKAEAFVAEHFVHISEEPAINPSLALNFRGCALRCKACQQHQFLDTRGSDIERLTPDLWSELDFSGARSLSMIGGNPDESLAAILGFLCAAPLDFALPIVWNNHAYMTPEAIRILAGMVDCYVPDLKFDQDACAQAYTHVSGYVQTARDSIAQLLQDGVPVIVRILLLPGHSRCCHGPSLAWLAERDAENLFVSLRGQYAPDWRVTEQDAELATRVAPAELATLAAGARSLGLRLVAQGAS